MVKALVEQKMPGECWAPTMWRTIGEARMANSNLDRPFSATYDKRTNRWVPFTEKISYHYKIIVPIHSWPLKAYVYDMPFGSNWRWVKWSWRDVEWLRPLGMIEPIWNGDQMIIGTKIYPPDYGCPELREVLVVDETGLVFGGREAVLYLGEMVN